MSFTARTLGINHRKEKIMKEQYAYGNPSEFYVETHYLHRGGLLSKPTVSYMVTYQDTLEEAESFPTKRQANEFITERKKS